MKRLMDRIAAAISAAAYAEEGDAETARAIAREGERGHAGSPVDRPDGDSRRRGAPAKS